MRVISGLARGTKLKTIDEMTTRPTLDRVKESLFNILQNQIKNSVVLDLFAGSGALGIEALSRGAAKAYFCDTNRDAINVIKENLNKTRLISKAEVLNVDYKKALNNINESFDLIFLDPPYKLDIAVDALKSIINNNLLKSEGIIVIETDEIDRDINELYNLSEIDIIDKRKYGRANLIFLKRKNWFFIEERGK